jgi:hypothetical protein
MDITDEVETVPGSWDLYEEGVGSPAASIRLPAGGHTQS